MKLMSQPWLKLMILALTMQLVACSKAESKNDDDEQQEIIIPVETEQVTAQDLTAYFHGTATLEAEEQAHVVAKVAGVVEKLFVEEGDVVQAGQALAQLDTEQLQIEQKRLSADLNRLSNELKRSQKIYQKNLISSEQYEKVKFEYEAHQASYDLIMLKINYATIKAPIAGVITQRKIKVGNMIQQNEVSFTITDFDPLLAIVHIPERSIEKIKLQQQALVSLDAFSQQTFKAFVKRINPMVDANSGTFKVTLQIDDDSQILRPGLFSRVAIITGMHQQAKVIHKDALLRNKDEAAVYIIRDAVAHKQEIVTGMIEGEFIEILQGLEIGDEVVVTGQNSLKNESKVKIL